ncbi:DNA methyltransferase [Kocuria rosea]|uniref:DNA methyltransferase n=1 Tax=Kocuria rosea TaxID=1275 RepID=UPI00203D943F|nr:site-specific DNA-methyltransferase [Kocuria rosea]MCM3687826.1 site-specific DNA-methyltransferase [Kocuria rosea]
MLITPHPDVTIGVGPAAHMIAEVADPGSVSMAYLDPPYGTGRHFGHYADPLVGARWAEELASTLRAIEPVLAGHATIWIHLDEVSVYAGKNVADEVYGPGRYISTVVWKKKDRPSYTHPVIANVLDYILVYAGTGTPRQLTVGQTTQGKRYPVHHRQNKIATLIFPPGSVTIGFEASVIPAGRHDTQAIASTLDADCEFASGVNITAMVMTGPFRYTQTTIDSLAADGGIFHCPRLPLRPNYLAQQVKGKPMTTLLSNKINGTPTNEVARAETGFATPKPVGLIETIILASTLPGEIVLDAYGGSLTTAVAAVNTGRKAATTEINPETVRAFGLPRFGEVGPDTVAALTAMVTEQQAQATTVDGEDVFEPAPGL